MKVRIYFDPLDLEISDYPIQPGEAIDGAALVRHIEENWTTLVDATQPTIGALKILAIISLDGPLPPDVRRRDPKDRV